MLNGRLHPNRRRAAQIETRHVFQRPACLKTKKTASQEDGDLPDFTCRKRTAQPRRDFASIEEPICIASHLPCAPTVPRSSTSWTARTARVHPAARNEIHIGLATLQVKQVSWMLLAKLMVVPRDTTWQGSGPMRTTPQTQHTLQHVCVYLQCFDDQWPASQHRC
jgi:hypothetical protein